MIKLDYTLKGCNRTYAGNPSLNLIGGSKPQSIELDEGIIKAFKQDLDNLSAQSLLVYEVINLEEKPEPEAELAEPEAELAEPEAEAEAEEPEPELAEPEVEAEEPEVAESKSKSKGKK